MALHGSQVEKRWKKGGKGGRSRREVMGAVEKKVEGRIEGGMEGGQEGGGRCGYEVSDVFV